MPNNLLLENISKDEMVDYLKRLYIFMKSKLSKIDKPPKVFFNSSKSNAEDILGKTGYYDPESCEIHLFITNRHPKDVLRSFAHELIHHEQNCSGLTSKMDMSKTHETDYASKNKDLRNAELDAFKRGNILFRDWTDGLKVKRDKGDLIMENDSLKALEADMRKVLGLHKNNPTSDAEQQAVEAAAAHFKHDQGRDLRAMKNEQEAKENLEENNNPHPELFQKKERVMQDAFQKREDLIFQELMKRFTTEQK